MSDMTGKLTPSSATSQRIVWHEHCSADPDAAREFYVELLGLTVEQRGPQRHLMVSPYDLTAYGAFVHGAPAGWWPRVVVADLEDVAAKARANGGTADHHDDPDGGPAMVIADPEGAALTVALGVPTSSRPEPEGASTVVWNKLLSNADDRQAGFWTTVLGWVLRPSVNSVVIQTREKVDCGALTSIPTGVAIRPTWVPEFATRDVAGSVAKAVKLGAHVLDPPRNIPGVGWNALLIDPHEAVFAVWDPAGYTGYTGAGA